MMLRSLFLPVLLASALSALPAGTKQPADSPVPSPRDHCAVCGMFVADFPGWSASVTFKDGMLAWFDGPRDLFTCLLDLNRYAPRHRPEDIAAIQVKDYYGLVSIDGRKAFYVLGGDVLGPMGKELVPFATEAAAREFLKDHKGRLILSFQQITPGILKGMT